MSVQHFYLSQKWSTSLVTKYQQKGLPKHLCIPKVEFKPWHQNINKKGSSKTILPKSIHPISINKKASTNQTIITTNTLARSYLYLQQKVTTTLLMINS
ncbi:hypothetical protein RHGRI_006218 [Rhododendron griersonianum]|uniref:Uncharacterized protein n=1 Tax=Rhododendron griersonianum TaxID=479676 RepID=A0AAV6KTE4_9ERIC|nr:hypothetical protein RHGRI_006218 [Rhododendron griersonianum]